MVQHSHALLDHHLLYNRLSLFDSLACAWSHHHDPLVETFQVAHFLRLFELVCVLMRLNFQVIVAFLSGQVSQARYFNDGDGLEWNTPGFLNVVFLAETLLGLKILQHRVIIGRVRRNRRHNTSALHH